MSPRVLLKINVAVNLGLGSSPPTAPRGSCGIQAGSPGRGRAPEARSQLCLKPVPRGEARAHGSSDGLAKALSSTMSVIMEKRKHRAQPADTYLRSTCVCQNDHLPTWRRTESGAWHTVGAWQMVALTLIVFTVITVTPMSPRTERYKPRAFEFRHSPTPPPYPPLL